MENLPEFYENYRKKTPGIINNSKKHPIFVFNLLFADLRDQLVKIITSQKFMPKQLT